ncbi:hypothetical protein HU230_0023680 [Bradyrhizobium quebecense]|uniref:hypothetical protein n=1 Tax=Bradyrhizobium quebecense TaxID=2748629 RepID=UPI001CD3FFB2|nr:hypothetical protein [Bradyrhizobium quebecense]UGA41385.1 hypothetical protein HU230_0023680 [Bradyrhizobium quebecense]
MNAASQNHAARLREISRLIDDRPSERIFEVDRRIFTDPDVFDAELRYIFEANGISSAWNPRSPGPTTSSPPISAGIRFS